MFGIAHSASKQDYYVAPLPSYNGDSWAELPYSADGTVPDLPDTVCDFNILMVIFVQDVALRRHFLRHRNRTGHVLNRNLQDPAQHQAGAGEKGHYIHSKPRKAGASD